MFLHFVSSPNAATTKLCARGNSMLYDGSCNDLLVTTSRLLAWDPKEKQMWVPSRIGRYLYAVS